MEENNTKEINLLQLISIVFDWIKRVSIKFLNSLGFLIRLAYKRIVIISVIVGLCVVVGQYLARPSARIYKAEALAMIYGGDAQTVREVAKQLEYTSQTNKMISLATKLSLPDSIAKNIVSIKSFYMIDYMRDSVADKVDYNNSHSLTDTSNVRMKDRVYLQILTKKINQIPTVQNAVLKYFNSNEILNSKLQVKRSEFEQQIKICDKELYRIDSLAKISYFKDKDNQLKFDNNKLLLGEQSKQLFYGELLRLQQLKSEAQVKLNDYNQPVELPSGFVVNPKALNGRVKYGIFSILIGFALGVILSLFLEYLKPVIKYLKNE